MRKQFAEYHKRAIGPTWNPGPLTKHHYDRWPTLFSMTNYQHCTRESAVEEACCRIHKRAIGPTRDTGPKLPQNHKRSLTKHLYDRWSTLLSINWRKRSVVLQYFTKWTLGPILGLGPQISSITMTNYQHCTRKSVVEEACCRIHKKSHRAHMGPWTKLPQNHKRSFNQACLWQMVNSVEH